MNLVLFLFISPNKSQSLNSLAQISECLRSISSKKKLILSRMKPSGLTKYFSLKIKMLRSLLILPKLTQRVKLLKIYPSSTNRSLLKRQRHQPKRKHLNLNILRRKVWRCTKRIAWSKKFDLLILLVFSVTTTKK